ncbi:MAG: TlyA family RNA methyltransferase, partial [Bdellovibrio sp.]
RELIEAGQVFTYEKSQKKTLKKPSLSVSENTDVQVLDGPVNRYVSRGGLKLEGALEHLQIAVQDWKILDVGISTGGFTDCLLKKGAAQVVGVDVGHGQVSPVLLKNPKLTVLEGVNARTLSQESRVLEKKPESGFDLVVMDVSFISIVLIIPELQKLIRPQGLLLSLVKPQFEVGVDGLAKGGIVKDISLYAKVEERVREVCSSQGMKVRDYFPSSIQGKDGNNEFFVLAEKS